MLSGETFTLKRKDPALPDDQFEPQLDMFSGANYWDRDTHLLYVIVRGTQPIDIRTSPVIQVYGTRRLKHGAKMTKHGAKMTVEGHQQQFFVSQLEELPMERITIFIQWRSQPASSGGQNSKINNIHVFRKLLFTKWMSTPPQRLATPLFL